VVLGRPLDRFPVSLASRACLANLSWGILDTWLNQRNSDLSIRRNGSTFRALRISQVCTLLPSVTPSTLCKFPISSACTWDNILSAITQDSWPQVRIGTKTDLKTDSCLKAPVLYRAIKLTQNYACLTNPRIISLFRLPSHVNTTPRCLNVTCCSVLSLTWSVHLECTLVFRETQYLGLFSANVHSGSVARSRRPMECLLLGNMFRRCT